MTESTKINFSYRKISQIQDITDLVEMLFPGNRNQQHAAGRILLELKWAETAMSSLKGLRDRHDISRRTLERTRAKLARVGLIERISWMNARYGGQEGWILSGRMSTGLRQLASVVDAWRKDLDQKRQEREEALIDILK